MHHAMVSSQYTDYKIMVLLKFILCNRITSTFRSDELQYSTLPCPTYPWSFLIVQVPPDLDFPKVRNNLKSIADVSSRNRISQLVL